MTYADVNALLLFVLWPLVTVALLSIFAAQAVQLRRHSRTTGR